MDYTDPDTELIKQRIRNPAFSQDFEDIALQIRYLLVPSPLGNSMGNRRSFVNHNKNRRARTGTETYMDVVVTFALDLEGRVEGDVLLRARLDVDFLIYITMHRINQVVDPDPDWIRIQSGLWIRIRNRNPDPNPGGQK